MFLSKNERNFAAIMMQSLEIVETMETRKVTKEDFELISQWDNTLTKELFDTVDYDNSALTIADNGILLAVILTRINSLIDTFPQKKFPRGRWLDDLYKNYQRENNHEIVHLYRFERNGRMLERTKYYIINGSKDCWWIDKSNKCLIGNFNKIDEFFTKINHTEKYYLRFLDIYRENLIYGKVQNEL